MTSKSQFCPLCDVSLDLHDGPNTCDTAAQKEFIIALPFALPLPVLALGVIVAGILGEVRVSRNRASAKAAGRNWERAICDYLVAHGWIHAERRRLAGTADKGDVAGIPGLVIEAKNTKGYDLAAAVDEAETERDNAGAKHGVAWIKRKGHTFPGKGYVVMTGDTFAALLKEAGY